MVVGIAVMAFTQVAPCRAGWVPAGGDTSGGAPDSDSDDDSGNGWWWEWEYDSSGISRGSDEYGCWASGSMTYDVGMLVDIKGPNSVSVAPPAGRSLSVYADYNYDNEPNQGYRSLDFYRDVYVSGTVYVSGHIDNAALGPNDTADTWAIALGFSNHGEDGYDYGYGGATGNMQEFSYANIYYQVAGDATQDPGTNPVIYNSPPGNYSVYYDFTIDVYDTAYYQRFDANSPSAPSSVTMSAQLYVDVDGTASVDVSQGYTGKASSCACAGLIGWSIVDVDLHN